MDFNSLSSILEGLNGLFKLNKSPAPPVPSPLILTGVPSKTGMSAQRVANNVIKRKEQAGLSVGALPDGSPNPDEIMERIRVEEIFKELLTNAKITIVIPPGTPVTAAGGNAGGPVVVQGATVSITTGFGQIQ